jgi:nitrite reductase/ring-hydroxylating ferredoxin subunit
MELHIGALGDFEENNQSIVKNGEFEIGVFRLGDDLYAYDNRCAHQGGPACEGKIIPKVIAVVGPDRAVQCDDFSDTDIHFVCPWHGWEYDMRTGRSAADPRVRLHKFEVLQRSGEVYLVLP